jgi:hypothetical protein
MGNLNEYIAKTTNCTHTNTFGQPTIRCAQRYRLLLKDFCKSASIIGNVISDEKVGHIDHQYQLILKRLGLPDKQPLTKFCPASTAY